MPTASKRRGRPRGSGINDTKHLHEIAGRIAAEPGLKPTTAIKAMGISDPSSIRRLRDKYKKFVDSQQASRPVPPASRPIENLNGSAVRELTAATTRARKSGPKKRKAPASKAKTGRDSYRNTVRQHPSLAAVEAPTEKDTDWVASWCTSNLEAMADAMEAQLAVTRSVLSVPYFALAVRQQLALNALALSILPVGHKRRTLH